MIEFGIHYLRREDGRLLVSGRCYQGPIALSDRFERVSKPDSLLTGEDSLIKDEQQVSLTVESIKAYGHLLKKLDEGVTAELELSGSGMKLVGEDSILRSAD